MGNLFWDYAVFTIARLISEFSVLIKVDIFGAPYILRRPQNFAKSHLYIWLT